MTVWVRNTTYTSQNNPKGSPGSKRFSWSSTPENSIKSSWGSSTAPHNPKMWIKIAGQNIDADLDTWHLHIQKPIFETTVAVSDTIIKKAIKAKVKLRVTCPGGDETVAPSTFRKEGKKFEKIFLHPSNPMVLYRREIKAIQ